MFFYRTCDFFFFINYYRKTIFRLVKMFWFLHVFPNDAKKTSVEKSNGRYKIWLKSDVLFHRKRYIILCNGSSNILVSKMDSIIFFFAYSVWYIYLDIEHLCLYLCVLSTIWNIYYKIKLSIFPCGISIVYKKNHVTRVSEYLLGRFKVKTKILYAQKLCERLDITFSNT